MITVQIFKIPKYYIFHNYDDVTNFINSFFWIAMCFMLSTLKTGSINAMH